MGLCAIMGPKASCATEQVPDCQKGHFGSMKPGGTERDFGVLRGGAQGGHIWRRKPQCFDGSISPGTIDSIRGVGGSRSRSAACVARPTTGSEGAVSAPSDTSPISAGQVLLGWRVEGGGGRCPDVRRVSRPGDQPRIRRQSRTGRRGQPPRPRWGGARAGRGSGTSVGSSRWVRMRWMTRGSSMRAISRQRPPHREHTSTSNPNARRIRSPHLEPAWRAGRGSAAPSASVEGLGTIWARQVARAPRTP